MVRRRVFWEALAAVGAGGLAALGYVLLAIIRRKLGQWPQSLVTVIPLVLLVYWVYRQYSDEPQDDRSHTPRYHLGMAVLTTIFSVLFVVIALGHATVDRSFFAIMAPLWALLSANHLRRWRKTSTS